MCSREVTGYDRETLTEFDSRPLLSSTHRSRRTPELIVMPRIDEALTYWPKCRDASLKVVIRVRRS